MEREDYGRMRVLVLRARAAAGDAEARQELARRGATPETEITQLDYRALRRLVLAWRDGRTPEERAQHRATAERAQFELECRYRADCKVRRPWIDPVPVPPPAPPWLAPRLPRCLDWQRPEGSKLYPSEIDRQRAAFTAWAREREAQQRR